MIILDWTWIVTFASIIGVVANIKKKTWCFAVWLCTNAAWMVYDFSIGAYAQSFLFFVYVILAIWGLIEWGYPKQSCDTCLKWKTEYCAPLRRPYRCKDWEERQ